MSGVLVAGRYRLGGLLGAGSTGEVHAAVDERLEVEVAVKLARPGATPRLLAQARAAAGLVHPRVVRVLDLGEHEGRGFVVTDLVRGTSAARLLTERPPTAREAVQAAAAAADGLAYLHARGVRHGDLAPGNVQVPDEGGWSAAVLLDVGGVTREPDGAVRVSPWYCAPEVARGGAATPESDVYGLAATLYHLLTGAPVHDHADPATALAAQGTEPWVAPSARRPDLPRGLDLVLHAAMSARPERRPLAERLRDDLFDLAPGCPQTAAEPLRAAGGTRRVVALSAPVGGSVVPGHTASGPAGPARAVARRPERRGRAAGTVAVGVVVLALLAVARWWQPPPGHDERSSADVIVVVTGPAEPSMVTPRPTPTPTAATPAASPADELVWTVVPGVVALAVQDARRVLEAAGLTVGPPTSVDGPAPAGTVVASDPAAGSPAPPGAEVRLQIASGLVTVPDLVGSGASDAAGALAATGLVARVRTVAGPAVGVVAGCEPAAGSRVDVGGTVTLLVGDGASATPSPTPTSTAPAVPSPSATPSG